MQRCVDVRVSEEIRGLEAAIAALRECIDKHVPIEHEWRIQVRLVKSYEWRSEWMSLFLRRGHIVPGYEREPRPKNFTQAFRSFVWSTDWALVHSFEFPAGWAVRGRQEHPFASGSACVAARRCEGMKCTLWKYLCSGNSDRLNRLNVYALRFKKA